MLYDLFRLPQVSPFSRASCVCISMSGLSIGCTCSPGIAMHLSGNNMSLPYLHVEQLGNSACVQGAASGSLMAPVREECPCPAELKLEAHPDWHRQLHRPHREDAAAASGDWVQAGAGHLPLLLLPAAGVPPAAAPGCPARPGVPAPGRPPGRQEGRHSIDCSALCALQWYCKDLTRARQIYTWLNTSMQKSEVKAGFSAGGSS